MKKPPEPNKTDAIRAHYEPRIRSGRPHWQVLDWASRFSQEKRFEVLLRHVDLAGRSLLDVGCGLGDLRAFLVARGVRPEYTGVDLCEAMVQAARAQQPDGRFHAADLFDRCPFGDRAFDVVFCSGAFNLNLGNNLSFAARAIERFFFLAREVVTFNMLHRRAAGDDPTYFYFDPEEVLPLARQPGWDVRLIDDYLPNDFTVLCRRAL